MREGQTQRGQSALQMRLLLLLFAEELQTGRGLLRGGTNPSRAQSPGSPDSAQMWVQITGKLCRVEMCQALGRVHAQG